MNSITPSNPTVKVTIDGKKTYKIQSFYVPADETYVWIYFLDKSGIKISSNNVKSWRRVEEDRRIEITSLDNYDIAKRFEY